MSSVCISNCVDDARIPVRATYRNVYKWPESDAQFMKTTLVGSNHVRRGRPMVVDSISCRQMYLRSYTFSRKETVPEKTKKCLDRVKERVVTRRGRKRKGDGVGSGKRRCMAALRRVKAVSPTTVCAVFRRLLSCSASVDVATP